jgi:hypothetical protein
MVGWSPSLLGEESHDEKPSQRSCTLARCFLGYSHKRRVKEVGEELALNPQRKRCVHLKPDSPLVLLFWARHLIAWLYLKGESYEQNEGIPGEVRSEAA